MDKNKFYSISLIISLLAALSACKRSPIDAVQNSFNGNDLQRSLQNSDSSIKPFAKRPKVSASELKIIDHNISLEINGNAASLHFFAQTKDSIHDRIIYRICPQQSGVKCTTGEIAHSDAIPIVIEANTQITLEACVRPERVIDTACGPRVQEFIKLEPLADEKAQQLTIERFQLTQKLRLMAKSVESEIKAYKSKKGFNLTNSESTANQELEILLDNTLHLGSAHNGEFYASQEFLRLTEERFKTEDSDQDLNLTANNVQIDENNVQVDEHGKVVNWAYGEGEVPLGTFNDKKESPVGRSIGMAMLFAGLVGGLVGVIMVSPNIFVPNTYRQHAGAVKGLIVTEVANGKYEKALETYVDWYKRFEVLQKQRFEFEQEAISGKKVIRDANGEIIETKDVRKLNDDKIFDILFHKERGINSPDTRISYSGPDTQFKQKILAREIDGLMSLLDETQINDFIMHYDNDAKLPRFMRELKKMDRYDLQTGTRLYQYEYVRNPDTKEVAIDPNTRELIIAREDDGRRLKQLRNDAGELIPQKMIDKEYLIQHREIYKDINREARISAFLNDENNYPDSFKGFLANKLGISKYRKLKNIDINDSRFQNLIITQSQRVATWEDKVDRVHKKTDIPFEERWHYTTAGADVSRFSGAGLIALSPALIVVGTLLMLESSKEGNLALSASKSPQAELLDKLGSLLENDALPAIKRIKEIDDQLSNLN